MTDVNDRLRAAARVGDMEEVKSLAQHLGCNVSASDGNGMTALMWASIYGHEACIQILLSKSNALAKDSYGATALMRASFYGHKACIKLLLPVSDAQAKDRNGLTASAHAQKMGRESLAQFIDAYILAKSECVIIDKTTGPGAPRKRAAPRM